MNILVRCEQEQDYDTVNHITFLAFKDMEFSDGDEHELVAKLRNSKDFIPELSLVAVNHQKIIGHIMFTSARIISGSEVYPSLTLAPVSVHPDFQKKGIGSKLIKEGLKIAGELGYNNVNVIGHPDYYPKFGFKSPPTPGISPPVEVPDGVFMVLELKKDSLKGIHGKVQYASEFGY